MIRHIPSAILGFQAAIFLPYGADWSKNPGNLHGAILPIIRQALDVLAKEPGSPGEIATEHFRPLVKGARARQNSLHVQIKRAMVVST